MSNVLDKAKSINDFVINFRRELHENPEPSGQEFKTQEKIMSTLSLRNDEELAALADKSAAKVLGEGKNISLPRYMGSEDMP